MSKKLWLLAGGMLVFLGSMAAFQRTFREYPGIEYNDFPVPPDYQHPAEFMFARLMYPPYTGQGGFGFGGFTVNSWQEGRSIWTQDYPRADRHFLRALRRLTRIDARSVEQPVNLDDDDDVYNFPFLYAVQVGQWDLTDAQAVKLRDFILRGGFLMVDDFWGATQWQTFEASMSRVFPDLIPLDLNNDSPIFHAVYDLENRYQVPGARYLETGSYEKCQGCPAQWRAISDAKGRILVAMTVNSDVGDSWEFADDPRYDEKFSALGIRIGVNYIVYSMTH
ncbi:MAG TPA: DUF4159 domain-containing protein [Bryobacteraceae bacterium]|nr:DUF4159 domain-containing protein [Bryobacteraceae bacterium]